MKKKYHKIVLVKWYDAFASSSGWVSKNADWVKNDTKGLYCQTVGFLLFEGKKCIKLGLSVCDDNDTISEVITIPKAWIKSKRVLESIEEFKE